MFTGVYCLCTSYIASLFVMNMEGMILFLWLSGVVIREYIQNAPLVIGILMLCAVFSHSYMPYSAHTTELTV